MARRFRGPGAQCLGLAVALFVSARVSLASPQGGGAIPYPDMPETAQPEDSQTNLRRRPTPTADESSKPSTNRRAKPADGGNNSRASQGTSGAADNRGERPGREQENSGQKVEPEEYESLAHRDDPNAGLSLEFLSGVLLLEGSRGQGVSPTYLLGGRGTWEFGRRLYDEFWREALFLDVTSWFAFQSDGTKEVFTRTAHYNVTIAPAIGWPFGGSPSWGAIYVQVGGGLNYSATTLSAQGIVTPIGGFKPLLQYGAGLRFRPPLAPSGRVRLSVRIEFTRLHRAYMMDTFFGGSVGFLF